MSAQEDLKDVEGKLQGLKNKLSELDNERSAVVLSIQKLSSLVEFMKLIVTDDVVRDRTKGLITKIELSQKPPS